MERLRSRKGQGMVEYLMIAAFAVALAIYLVNKVQHPAQQKIDNIANQIGNTGTGN